MQANCCGKVIQPWTMLLCGPHLKFNYFFISHSTSSKCLLFACRFLLLLQQISFPFLAESILCATHSHRTPIAHNLPSLPKLHGPSLHRFQLISTVLGNIGRRSKENKNTSPSVQSPLSKILNLIEFKTKGV